MADLARLVDLGRRLTAGPGGVLLDTCRIDRDPQRALDDTFDPQTLLLVQPEDDSGQVWAGPCAVLPRSELGGAGDAGRSDHAAVAPDGDPGYRALLPPDAPALAVDDVLTVTAAVRSPALIGRRFRVTSRPVTPTFLVLTSVTLQALP